MLTGKENPISAGASIIRLASNGDADAMRALLAEGADVDQRGRGGHTALMVAAIFYQVDIARLLLAAGANVQLQDNLGLTAKDWADRRGSWDVAQLISNAPPAETESSPKNAPGKLAQLKVETERRSLEAQPETPPQQDPVPGTEEQMTDPQHREVEDLATSLSEQEAAATWSSTGEARSLVEEERRSSKTEPTSARLPDAVRFMMLHKQIMAAQARRQAEQAHREAEDSHRSFPIETNIAPQQDAPLLSEREALATWSSTGEARRENDLHASPIETESSPQPDDPKVADEQQRTKAEPDRREKEARPTATQLARIAATIEHLRLLEESSQRAEGEVPYESDWPAGTDVEPAALDFNDPESSQRAESEIPYESDWPAGTDVEPAALDFNDPESSQRAEGEVPYESDWPARTDVEPALDSNDPDTTLERLTAEVPTRPAVLERKTVESFNRPPFKRCPECNTVYENPLFTSCAYDAAKLISDDDSIFSHFVTRDWSRQTLWASVAIIAVLGASLGYLINNYRSRQVVSSAPTTAISNTPIATQTGQPDITRSDSPLISGALSGMEVDVPEPEYPAQARAEGVSGTVKVRVQVNQKGRVVLARSSGADRRLRAAAVEAAQRATFSAEKLAAHGRVVSGTITYNFVAQTESPAATGSPVPAQTNSPFATGSSSATGSSAATVGRDYPVVGGPLAGAESKLPLPDYPEKAKSRGIHGTVTVVVRVNRAGKTISWRTLKGDSQLRAAALKAAKKSTFSPSKLPGKGEVVGTITYNFR